MAPLTFGWQTGNSTRLQRKHQGTHRRSCQTGLFFGESWGLLESMLLFFGYIKLQGLLVVPSSGNLLAMKTLVSKIRLNLWSLILALGTTESLRVLRLSLWRKPLRVHQSGSLFNSVSFLWMVSHFTALLEYWIPNEQSSCESSEEKNKLPKFSDLERNLKRKAVLGDYKSSLFSFF